MEVKASKFSDLNELQRASAYDEMILDIRITPQDIIEVVGDKSKNIEIVIVSTTSVSVNKI